MPLQLREAQIVPASFNEADNTVDVVWTTGARRRAYDWWNDVGYEEELVVDAKSVDMSRFEKGVIQVLDNHDIYGGTRSILGVALRGAITKGEGTATLKLSTDPAKAGVVGDIRAGVIRSISFMYSVEKYEITRAQDRTDGVNMPLYRAVNWTPKEISFVTVPADPNASTREQREPALTRSQPANGHPCEFVTRESISANGGQPAATSTTGASMKESNAAGGNNAPATEPNPQRSEPAAPAAGAQPAAQSQEPTEAQRAAVAAEQARSATITDLCARHGVSQLAAGLIRGGQSVEQARTAILEEIAVRDAAQGGHRNVNGSVTTVADEVETRFAGIQEAFLHRIDSRSKLSDNGRQYRGMTILEIGREHLERSGVSTRGMDRLTLATRMMQFRSGGSLSTSDFANLLQNVATKRLRNSYEENQPSYQRWARRAPDAPDFKSMSVVNLAGAPDLLQVNEHGEFKYGAMTDGKETYSLLTYGRIVSITRQAIINDDLRGFDRLVGAFGNSAARLENRTVYAILTANAALSDTGALFNATAVTTAGGHANLTSSGTAISVTSLGVGRKQMRLQKGLQSEELNITPKFLIVPAAQENLAYQYTSSQFVPATSGAVNEFRAGGRTALEPIVEAVLDANSGTAWYLAADPGQVDTVEYCYLEGAAGPVIESEMGFEVDGISMKARLDFAAKAIDFRGLYKNVGA